MKPVALALWTLLSHWRRHPFEFASIALGLAVATMLWSGVNALNEQARQSYARAEAAFSATSQTNITRRDGESLTIEAFTALRRAGIPVSPLLEGGIVVGGTRLRLIGLEPFTLPAETGLTLSTLERGDVTRFFSRDGLALISEETLQGLGAAAGDRLQTADGLRLPPLQPTAGLARGRVLLDIGQAERLLGRAGQIDRLLLPDSAAEDSEALAKSLVMDGQPAFLVNYGVKSDISGLTRSFHLNLTAFAMLSFLVGLFIIHAAISLAFEQRKPAVRTIRALGIPARALASALLIEAVLLAITAGFAGLLAGAYLAEMLLPDMATSLGGLFGADVSRDLVLTPFWWITGFTMALLGVLLSTADKIWQTVSMPLLQSARPEAWHRRQSVRLVWQTGLGAALGVSGFLFWRFGSSLPAAFTVMTFLLLSCTLLLPAFLVTALRGLLAITHAPLARWFFADARQQISGLSVALMALLLALGVNLGVGSMVKGFRTTFLTWLDERLVAEAYVSPVSQERSDALLAQLEGDPRVLAVLPSWRDVGQAGGMTVEAYTITDHPTYRGTWSFLAQLDDAWQKTLAGQGVMASEQLARRLDLALGDTVPITGVGGRIDLPLVAIYPDYGNPRGQIRLAVDPFEQIFPTAPRRTYILRIADGQTEPLLKELRETLNLGDAEIIDQAGLKAFSIQVFERTFTVTLALNTLTLFVAGAALFASLTTLSESRRLQLAPLWASGVERSTLVWLDFLKTLMLAGLTALAAIPTGIGIAWGLVAVINVAAFGWEVPLYLYPADWLKLAATAVLTAIIATIWPTVKLIRLSPARLAKGFADAQ